MLVCPWDPPELRWLAAVALGGRGCYSASWALLERIVHSPGDPGAIRAHAAITRASHLRQLGGHRLARRWDGLGLATACAALQGGAGEGGAGEGGAGEGGAGEGGAGEGGAGGSGGPGFDAAAAKVDALLGLAADALGLAEFALADRLLERVESLASAHPSWRPAVRLHWIRAELALALDEPRAALEHAQRAVTMSRQAGAVRHEVKSQLVLVVARSCVGEPNEQLYPSLGDLAERAIGNRLYSLEWPMRLLLAQMEGPEDAARASVHRARYSRLLAAIRQASDPIGRLVLDRSPWVAAAFGR